MTDVTVPTAQERAESLNFARGLINLVMTFLVPGSVQRAKGNIHIGRFAMRVWEACLLLLLFLGAWFLIDKLALVSFFAHPAVLRASVALILFVAFGWVALFCDAWRLSRPVDMPRNRRLLFTVLSGIMPVVLVISSLAAARAIGAAAHLTSEVFAGGGETEAHEGRINVLLIGADNGSDREGMRTDSLNVVSIDAKTGRSVIIGIPRNIEGAKFPDYSPMRKIYPDGYSCPDHSCMMNAINTDVEQNHADLYPNSKHPGITATKEAIEYLTGLNVNYTVIVDLNGFSGLVDAVGGIDITLNKAIVIFWVNDVIGGTPRKTIGPGKVHLNGTDALDLARVRHDSNDFVRMTRQKCIMNAMLTQLDPKTVLAKFTDIANAGAGIVESDVPASEAGYLVKLAQQAKSLPIQTIQLIPPLLWPGDPNYDDARQAVRDQIAAAAALDDPAKAPAPKASATQEAAPAPRSETTTTQNPAPATTQTADVTEAGASTSENLTETCSAF
ncbi:MAG: LCP family protein [Propionibacteriaceae bacterium]